MTSIGESLDDVELALPSGSAAPPPGNKLNIKTWPPNINWQRQLPDLNVSGERPRQGIISKVEVDSRFLLVRQQPIVEVPCSRPGSIKFGQ